VFSLETAAEPPPMKPSVVERVEGGEESFLCIFCEGIPPWGIGELTNETVAPSLLKGECFCDAGFANIVVVVVVVVVSGEEWDKGGSDVTLGMDDRVEEVDAVVVVLVLG